MISYQPISATGLYHIVRHMILAAVNELSRDLASAIQNGNRVDIALIQISFCQHTVDFFADAPIFPINHVVDDFAIGQFDFDQVGQDIVGITGGLASLCFSLPLAIRGMGVVDILILQQPILIVVTGNGVAIDMSTISIVIITVTCHDTIDFDLCQTAGEIVLIMVGGGAAFEGFRFSGDAAKFVTSVLDLVEHIVIVTCCFCLQFTKGAMCQLAVHLAQGGAFEQTIIGITTER